MTNVLTKVCTSCKTEKEIIQFNKGKTGKHGVRAICRICQKSDGKKYYDKYEKVAPINGVIKDLPDEIWKDVKGYEGKYQISNLGRLKRLTHYVTTKEGITTLFNEALMTSQKAGRGYLKHDLSKKNIKTPHYLHLIVWDNFSDEPRKDGYQIDHIDNVKANCAFSNLQQITIRHNSSKDRSPNTGATGVTCRNGVYKANIKIKRKGYHLGTFSTLEEAKQAYQKAADEAAKGVFFKEIRTNTSTYLGVSYAKKAKKWVCVYKRKYLGSFDTETQAHQAYQKALQSLENKAA